ncbi:hypothetical protein [Pontixanthobacter aquaemixtae]|uniref:EthD domain-containing protein n=1 Tax=Pontixanthobacter aquaemixtae TaxID=1958940 RepID=A0A844ZSC7_9SPHN|nr:hypothetical protein [Pontixanthobacter aquaemixtae]MXO89906.1 hypothetical protein [Pontixanthobacter aquaemixtae]
MIESLLVVLTNAAEGRDADFNDWYTNIHARDTMRMRGVFGQQRFAFSDEQLQDYPEGFPSQYLALYEVFDRKWFTQEHIDRAGTPFMIVEDSLDMSRLDDFYYSPLQFRDKAPRSFERCGVVLEQMQSIPGEEEDLRAWFNDMYFSQRFGEDGIVTGAFLSFEEYGQMMPFPPAHNHIAIWRIEDQAARNNWRKSNPLADCPHIDQGTLAISCWDVCSDRLIRDDVQYPTAEALAREEAARARIAQQDSVIKAATGRIKSG